MVKALTEAELAILAAGRPASRPDEFQASEKERSRHLSVADASSACCLSLTPSPLVGLRCADGQRSRADQAQQGVPPRP